MSIVVLYFSGVAALVAGAAAFPGARRPLLAVAVFAGLVLPATLFALLVWYLDTHDVRFG
ncbi:MAG: hypothetical protein ACJ73S_11345 [Mycobacteriales bacterium]